MTLLKKGYQYIKKETVLIVSALAACISMVFVPVSKEYFSYIDVRVLAILFCLMAVISGFQRIDVFEVLAKKLLKGARDTRKLVFILVLLCFFTSMWITNDVSLIAFVPFTIIVLTKIKKENLLIYVIVMQTIAANLGSMLTPVGNPQNLYLYTYYKLNAVEFFNIIIPFVIIAFLLLILSLFLVKKEDFQLILEEENKIVDKTRFLLLLILFFLCIATVFHVIPYTITFLITFLTILIISPALLIQIDYALLATFVCFFLFVGNMEQIDIIKNSMDNIIKGREVIASILVSQGISNVPAAVLLSSFTGDAKSLIIGTNIGGLGTLIASLASLISFKFYSKTMGAKRTKYLFTFTKYNLIYLGIFIVIIRIIY